jgi:hypothetical protein
MNQNFNESSRHFIIKALPSLIELNNPPKSFIDFFGSAYDLNDEG